MQIAYKSRKDPESSLFIYPGFSPVSHSFSKILQPLPYNPSSFSIYQQIKSPDEAKSAKEPLNHRSGPKNKGNLEPKGEIWGCLRFMNCIYQGSYIQKGEKRKAFVPHGTGVALFETGEVYLGDFENGLFEGKGALMFCKGGQIEGNFHKNKIHGEAVLTLLNGTCAILQFKEGGLDGVGLWATFGSEPQIDGLDYSQSAETWKEKNPNEIEWTLREYKKGILIQNVGSGKGIPPETQVASEVFPQLPRIIEDFTRSLNHPSCSYSGLLSNGIPEGIGILTLEEGVIECGYFSNGKLNGRGRRIFLKDGEIIDGTFRDGKPIGKCFKIEDIESRWAFFDTKTDEVLKEGTGYPRELMSLPRFEDQEAFVKEFQVKTVATLLNSVVFDMKQNSEKIFFELYSPKISLVFTMNRGFVPRTPRSKSKHAEAEWGSFQKPSRPDGVVVEKIRSGQSRMTIERPNEQRNNSESKMSLSKFNFSRENSIKSKELFSESKRTIPPFSNDEEIGRELDVLEKEESDFNQDSFAINQNKRGMEERNHQSHRKSKERGHGAQMDPRRLSNGVKRLNEAQRNSKGSQVHFKEREIVKFEENESSLEKPSRIESAIPHGNHYNQPQSHNSEPQSQRHERAVSFKQENSVINCERIQYETPQKPSSSFIFQKDNHQKDIDSTLNEAKEIKRDKEMNLIISQSSLMASETRNNHSLRTLGRKYEEMSKVEAQKDNKKIKEMMQRRVNLSERPKTPERPLRTLGVSHPSANWDKTPPVLFRKAIEANSKNPSRVISSLVYEHPQEPERDEPSQKNKRNRHSKSKSKSPGVQINHYPTCSQTLDDDCQKMKRNKSPNIQSRYMDHLPMLSYKDLAQVLQAKKKSGVVFHGTMEDPESLQFQRNFRGISPQKSFSLFSDDGKYGFQERSLTRITSEVCGTSPSKNLEREFQRSLTKEITHAKPKIEIRKRKEAEDSKDKREARNSFDRLEPGEFPERDQENTGPFYQRAQTMKDSPGPMGSSLSHSGARTMERSRSRSGDSRTDTYGGNVHTQLAVDHRGFDVGHYPVYNKYQ